MATISKDEKTWVVYRFIVLISLFVILFSILWGIQETRTNRSVGLDISAINCANLKSQIIDDDPGSNDGFINQVFRDNCLNGAVAKRYPNIEK